VNFVILQREHAEQRLSICFQHTYTRVVAANGVNK